MQGDMSVASQPSDKAVAHHEAGHAVAAIELGVPGAIAFIQVDDEDLAGGRVRFVPGTPDMPRTEDDARDWITQQLVGAEAEARITEELPSARSGAKDDYDRARDFANHVGIQPAFDPEEYPARTERDGYETLALEFVNEHWAKIVKLAKKILEERAIRTRTLTGGDVYKLFSG